MGVSALEGRREGGTYAEDSSTPSTTQEVGSPRRTQAEQGITLSHLVLRETHLVPGGESARVSRSVDAVKAGLSLNRESYVASSCAIPGYACFCTRQGYWATSR